ncbi:MAG: ribbon-helix-helix domain-containing protein [Candidatus Bathyarchaeia archaeon]
MEKRIIFRLPDTMYEKIQKLVVQGKFETTSQLIREALARFLAESEKA